MASYMASSSNWLGRIRLDRIARRRAPTLYATLLLRLFDVIDASVRFETGRETIVPRSSTGYSFALSSCLFAFQRFAPETVL